MGRIINTSSTNTPDTNTSRRQVNTHISTTSTTTTTTLYQIQTYHEDCWIDCIYFDASCSCYAYFTSFCKVACIPDDLPTGFGSIEHEYVDRRRLAAMAQEDVPKVEEDVPKVEVEQETVSTGESTNAPMMKKETNTTEK